MFELITKVAFLPPGVRHGYLFFRQPIVASADSKHAELFTTSKKDIQTNNERREVDDEVDGILSDTAEEQEGQRIIYRKYDFYTYYALAI